MTWPLWLRISLYLAGLLYSFVAVFIVADIFMCSIDSITSTTRQVEMALDLDISSILSSRELHTAEIFNILCMEATYPCKEPAKGKKCP